MNVSTGTPSSPMRVGRIAALAMLAGVCLAFAARGEEDSCDQPEPVCAARASVFPIAGFDPVGSAVRIGPERVVASRHVVADRTEVDLYLAGGDRIAATVIPSDYERDIVLLSAPDLPAGPVLTPAGAAVGETVYTVGADLSFGRVRAYDAGEVRILPAQDRPLARLHHTAYNQPGNSGGALVDASGGLVGIVASGGEGRFEAVPSSAITELVRRSGPEHAAAHAERGAAIRTCTLLLENLRDKRTKLGDEDVTTLNTACRRTGNRQFFDLAAEAFGTRQRLDESIALFAESVERDPNALNSRLGLVISYHFAGRYEDELPHLKFLAEHMPEDGQVIRLSIQAGVWAGEEAFARDALATLKRVNPNLAPAAERFLAAPPPRPPRR